MVSSPSPTTLGVSGIRLNRAPWTRLAGPGAVAVLDQALFSGSNFLLSLLLARWFTTTEYGAYSLAYAVFLLFSSIHAALFTEPMMVFGASKYGNRFAPYLRLIVRSHFGFTILAAALLGAASPILAHVYSPPVGAAFAGLAAASPAILLFWIVRRVPYITSQLPWAVAGGAVYMVVLLGGGFAMSAVGRLGTVSVYALMGAASLAASLVLLPRFLKTPPGFEKTTLAAVARDHWTYGRWAVATAIVQWFPGHVYYALLPARIGLDGSAGLRALMNFVMPVAQAVSALTMLLIPMLVRDRLVSIDRMRRTMFLFMTLTGTGSLLYLAALWLLRNQIFDVVYGGKYAEYAGWPLALTGLMPLATCLTAVLGSALRALERPDLVLWCSVGSLAAALTAGIPLANAYGVTGALAGLMASSAVGIILMYSFYSKASRRQP